MTDTTKLRLPVASGPEPEQDQAAGTASPSGPRQKAGRRDRVTTLGLTYRRERFARAVAEGKTFTDAYRASYTTTGMKPRSIHVEASRLAAVPSVSLRIEALIADRERAEQRDADRIRAFVVEQLQHEATHARQDSARVRALELLV
jgi:hypothetical protein